MRYIKYNIVNFKGIKDVTVDMSRVNSKIYTLVGLNESGKTTILEAISLLWEKIQNGEHHKLIPKSRKYNFTDKISIKATIEINDDDKLEIIDYLKTTHEFNEVVPVQSTFTIEKYFDFEDSINTKNGRIWSINLKGKQRRAKKIKDYHYSSDEWKGLVSFIEKMLLPRIIYYPNFLFDFPSRIKIYPIPTTKQQKIFYDMSQDILDSMDSELDIQKHIVNRIRNNTPANKEALKATISKMSGKVTELVLRTWGEIMNSHGKEIVIEEETVSGGYKYVDSEGKETVEDSYFIRINLKDGTEDYPISERSLGFRWFFSFLLFTELRKHRSNDPGETVFLLDEPASNLHSTAQKKLLSTFDKLVSENSKLIYTTHSHHLINPIHLESAYVVKNSALDYEDHMNFNAAKTLIEASPYRQFVASHPNQKHYYQPILDILEYQPGMLEAVPEIIITEGKNDFYSINYVNAISNTVPKEIHLYPGGGAGQNYQIIATYLAWGKDFKIILDGDTAGVENKKAYIEHFGNIVEDKIFTYQDVDSGWVDFKIEELYSLADRNKIMKSIKPNFTAFSKDLFHQEIQNLAAQGTDIGLDEETKANFNKVIDFLT